MWLGNVLSKAIVSNRLFFFCFLGVFILFSSSYSTAALPVQTAQPESDAITQIDEFFQTLAEEQLFSGSVLIAQSGEIYLSQGYGMADLEWHIPNTAQTKFRIGSLTKQFTGMAILLLQERGLLSVHDPICQYLEACADAWQEITIYQLLTHTSGIPDFVQFSDYTSTQAQPSLPQRTVERFINEPLEFQPGEAWSYSSSGYILLGLIIEEVSGQGYRRFLNDNFFEPLGMTATDLDNNRDIVENRAEGYQSYNLQADYLHMTITWSAGALYSTVEDLYLWEQALFNGGVVSPESFDIMMVDAVSTPNEGFRYAYGLVIDSSTEHLIIRHGGNTNGFRSTMLYYPDHDLTIIMLSNVERTQFDVMNEYILSRLIEEG